MTTSELKPCPFCGGFPKLEDHRLLWSVECQVCSACVLGERAPEPHGDDPVDWAYFEKSAVKAWNTRTPATTCPGHGRSECVSCCWPKGELEGKLAEKMVFDEKSRIGELADLLAMARPHVPVTDPLRGLINANLMQHRLEQDPWADFKDAAPVPEGSSQIELAKTLISLSGDIRQPINPSQAAWMAAQLEELGYRKQVQP